MGIHRGEVNRFGNGPQIPGTTCEKSHTGSSSVMEPAIQNATKEKEGN